jgi:hypothetical protein
MRCMVVLSVLSALDCTANVDEGLMHRERGGGGEREREKGGARKIPPLVQRESV